MGENVMERKLPEVSLKKLLGGLSPVVAVLIAFAVAGLVVLASGGNPLEAYRALAKGALGSWVGVKNTIRYTLPIILLAFSFSICNRCGYFNIGQEGQMYFAALGIAFVPQVIPNAPLCRAPRMSEPKMMPSVESLPMSAAVMPLKPMSTAKLL